MKPLRILLGIPMVLLASAAVAQGLTGYRYPIVEADVAKEMSVVGVNVEVSRVHIPVRMRAAIESPNLEIVSADPVSDNQLRLELNCSPSSECIPFFSTVDIKDARRVSAEMRLKIGAAVAANRRTAMPVETSPTSEPRLRVGSHVVLLIREGHLDIHLQVVTIDSGTVGQQVRVCTPDRRKIFRGTITDEGTVAGVME